MAQPEARLSRQIMAALRARGAFVFKVWGSAQMMAGLPDIVGCYAGRFIAVESKMPGNEPTTVQRLVHAKIRRAGGTVVVAHSVSEALKVLDGGVMPAKGRSSLTDALRASSERPRARRQVRGDDHVRKLLEGPTFLDP